MALPGKKYLRLRSKATASIIFELEDDAGSLAVFPFDLVSALFILLKKSFICHIQGKKQSR
jgi:hypothetical protein